MTPNFSLKIEMFCAHPFPKSPLLYPKNLLRLFFASKIIFIFEVIFKDPPIIGFKASIKITSQGYFLFFKVIFCLARLFLKNSLKRFLGYVLIEYENARMDPKNDPKRLR